MELSTKDLEKLEKVLEAIEKGTATTYDKRYCIDSLESVLNPKCAVCRERIKENMIIINDRKMHERCRPKYKG